MYASPQHLWSISSGWYPTPHELTGKRQALQLANNADFGLIMAIFHHGAGRTDWPAPRLTWRALSDTTCSDRNDLRAAARRLHENHVIELIDNGPSKAFTFNLSPLIIRIGILRQADLLVLQRKYNRAPAPRALQLPGLEDADNPSPELVADVIAKMNAATAARLARHRKAEPPDETKKAELRLRRATKRTGPVPFNPTYADGETEELAQ